MKKYYFPFFLSVIANFFAFAAFALSIFPDDAGNTLLGKNAGATNSPYYLVLITTYLIYLILFVWLFGKTQGRSKIVLFLMALPLSLMIAGTIIYSFQIVIALVGFGIYWLFSLVRS